MISKYTKKILFLLCLFFDEQKIILYFYFKIYCNINNDINHL